MSDEIFNTSIDDTLDIQLDDYNSNPRERIAMDRQRNEQMVNEISGTTAAPQDLMETAEDEEDLPLWSGFSDVITQVAAGAIRGPANAIEAGGELFGQDLGVAEFADDVLPEAKSAAGQMAGGLAQFFIPFGAFGKALRLTNFGAKYYKTRGMVAGALTDYSAFSPEDQTLADLAESMGMESAAFLPTNRDEDDSTYERRMKAVVEGAMLGGAIEAFIPVLRSIRSHGKAMRTSKVVQPRTVDSVSIGYAAKARSVVDRVHGAALRHELLLQARETLLGLAEGDPAFVKARAYLKKVEADPTENFPLSEQPEDVRLLVEKLEFYREGDMPLSVILEDQAANARMLSPIEALEGKQLTGTPDELSATMAHQQDRPGLAPELAQRLRTAIGDEADELSHTSIGARIKTAEADLAKELHEWEGVRTSREWLGLEPKVADQFDGVIKDSRFDQDTGWRTSKVVQEHDSRVAARLAEDGRTLERPAYHGEFRPVREVTQPVVKGGKLRLKKEHMEGLLRSVASGDVEGVGQAIIEGTNLDRILTDEGSIQEIFRELSQIFEGRGLNKKVKFKDMEKAAQRELDRLGISATEADPRFDKMLENLMPGSKLPTHHRMLVLRSMEVALASKVNVLGEAVLNAGRHGDLTTQAKFMQAAEFLLNINETRRLVQADAARGVASGRIKVTDDIVDPEAMAEILRQGSSPERLAAKLKALGDNPTPEQLAAVSKWSKWGKAAYGVWINGLLSGPLTHSVNLISNSAVAVWHPTEQMLGGLVKGDMVAVQESAEAYLDLLKGWDGIMYMAARAFSEKRPMLDRGLFGQIEVGQGASPLQELVGGMEQGFAKSLAEAADKVFGLPGRLLITSDEMAKGINYNLHARRAIRRHLRETQPDLDKVSFERELDQMLRDVQRFDEASNILSPSRRAMLKQMHEEALDQARRNTFTNDLKWEEGQTGRFGNKNAMGETIQKAAHRHPALRIVMPFVRTPTNLFRYATERTPGLAGLTQRNFQLRQAAKAGNNDAAVELAGKELAGRMVAGSALLMAVSGRITGGGPKNPGQRAVKQESDWQPYSIKIGDRWISYNRMDPFGMQVGLIADFITFAGEIPEAEADEYAQMVLGSMVKNLSSKRYLSGIFEVLRAVEQADSGGFERYFQRMAGSLVPNFLAQTNQGFVDSDLKELGDWRDAIGARMFPKDYEPRLNMFAEPVELRPGFSFEEMSAHDNGWENFKSGAASLTLPFRSKKVKGNAVRNRLADVGFSLDMRRTFSQIGDVDLTPKQKNEYIQFFAHPPKGPSFEEAMEFMLFEADARTSPDYEPADERFTDAFVREKLEGVRNKYRKNAETLMLRSSIDLFRDVQARKTKKKSPTAKTRDQRLEQLSNFR
jgi:hypothetical protein